jgi:hypothetical protein
MSPYNLRPSASSELETALFVNTQQYDGDFMSQSVPSGVCRQPSLSGNADAIMQGFSLQQVGYQQENYYKAFPTGEAND